MLERLGLPNLQSMGHMQPRMAVNVAQQKIINLLKTLWDFLKLHIAMYLMCGPRYSSSSVVQRCQKFGHPWKLRERENHGDTCNQSGPGYGNSQSNRWKGSKCLIHPRVSRRLVQQNEIYIWGEIYIYMYIYTNLIYIYIWRERNNVREVGKSTVINASHRPL